MSEISLAPASPDLSKVTERPGGLWRECYEFMEILSAGEWGDDLIKKDADNLYRFVLDSRASERAVMAQMAEALDNIRGFARCNLDGEWPASLRDIIRSQGDAADAALSAYQALGKGEK